MSAAVETIDGGAALAAAQAARAAGDFAGARAQLEARVAASPGDAAARVALARLLEDHFDDRDAARRHYEAVLEADPSHAAARSGLGSLMMEAGCCGVSGGCNRYR